MRRSLALAAVLATACGDPAPPRELNLVILSIDTLRADRLGAYGNDEWGTSPSPTLDALAARGVLAEHCYAPRGQTHPSLATLLTGLYPITHGIRENDLSILDPEHETLFQHLQAAGFQTGVFIANFNILGREKVAWIARGADTAADGFRGRAQHEGGVNESRFQEVWDDRVEASAMAYLDAVDTSKPFALWTHFYDVHKPYNPPAEYRRRFGFDPQVPEPLTDPGPESGQALEKTLAEFTLGLDDPSEAELRRIRGLYDETVAATDARVQRLLDKLAEMGELEDTLLVITADHGEELYDHNRYFFHGASIYDGVVKVPLIVVGPDFPAGRRVEGLTALVDLAPTLLAALGLPADPDHEGHDLGPLLRGETDDSPRERAYVEWQDLIYAVVGDGHKLILNSAHVRTRKTPWLYPFPGVAPDAGFEIDCVEGYDLAADPLETVNLLEGMTPRGLRAAPVPFEAHADALRDFVTDPRHRTAFGEGKELSADELETLESLGYLGKSSTRSDSIRGEPCDED